MYKSTDKICDLMSHEEEAIQIISRFGLSMGVGDQTIEQACETHGIHTPTFLAVVNYKVFRYRTLPQEIDLDTLQQYLRHAHAYFLDFRLPLLRQSLLEAIRPNDFSWDKIRTHIEHENAGMYEEHEHDDQRITDKLTEIKNLIIKYYPGAASNSLISVMSDLWHTEQDFADHCAIEDDILRPAIDSGRRTRTAAKIQARQTEELSDREKDILVQIVKGLSNKEIADVLFISPHTVITHRKNITRKLNIHSTAGLTIYAIVNKLVDINSLD